MDGRGHHSAFVGRQAERESLLDGFDKALHGRGNMAALSGEAGIGKARMVIGTLAPLPGMFKLTSFHISQDAQADPRDRKTIRGPVRSKSS